MRKNIWPLLAAAMVSFAPPVQARWMNNTEPVPVERLVKNVSAYVRENPNDARGFYTLGRIHSLAWARGTAELNVAPAKEEGKLPGFAPWESIRQKPQAPEDKPVEISPEALAHLVESVRNYSRATELAPDEALYQLGFGWMLEQGARDAWRLAQPWLAKEDLTWPDRAPRPPVSLSAQVMDAWRARSLEAYRLAYKLREAKDAEGGGIGPRADETISLEAGEGILRVLDARGVLNAENSKAEVARIRAAITALKKKPRAVTPIILPMGNQTTLSSLLDAKRTTTFDLAGDGIARRWPWVGAETGILVWDSENAGQIQSGRQLFGSATWWMMWPDGYAALRSLDDNRDGWLQNEELRGLRVWQDANGNGKSDAGEVKSLSERGIAAIATDATSRSENVPANLQGVRRSDGTFAPTFDWTPSSIPSR